MRTGRKDLAAATLVLDALKATFAYVAAAVFFHDEGAGLAAAAGAFLGHLYPVWLNFRGGKGVATFLGGLIGAAWPAAIAFALVWLGVAALTRYSSAAALAASAVDAACRARARRRRGSPPFSARSPFSYGSNTRPISSGCRNGTESRIGAKTAG